ncbi:hypothetical protein ARMSODRAFT_981302 [Armillaria solidipes]|uniref:Uncharacterized protein n=1 Tax=Armillaria solidipes TaxID=1076256 RepID=A0A2H3BD16_9AGAR|nr:hypothetical protein ARMSODRAFT_981302 [Armillaria solidipes]
MDMNTCQIIGEVAKSPDRFYLVDAKSPGATWKVLWYHDGGLKGKLEKTKVNILRPGISQQPMIFWEAIIYKQGLPVVPLSVLLLHKLKGWKDNMEPRLRSKYETDLEGIVGLLVIVIDYMSREEMKICIHWKRFALERFNEEFKEEMEHRVNLCCLRYLELRVVWRKLGW